MNMLNKLLLTFGASVAITLFNITSGILTARILGPGGKGELTAIILWPSVFASFGSLGIVDAMVYFTGKAGKNELRPLISNSLVIAIIQSLCLIGIGNWVIPQVMHQYSEETMRIAKLFLLFIPLNLVSLYLGSSMQGRMMMRVFNLSRVLVVAAYLAGLVVLLAAGWFNVGSCIVVLLGANLCVLIYRLFWAFRENWLGWKASIHGMRLLLSYGMRAQVGNIFTYLNLRLDQMIMAVMLPASVLGYYVVAVTISGGLNLISGAIAIISFPKIAGEGEESRQVMFLGRFLRLNVLVSGVLAICLVLAIPWLIIILFGRAYIPTIRPAQVLTAAAMIAGTNEILTVGLKGMGKPLISSYSQLLGLGATALFLFLLLPKWQAMGAAWASLFAYGSSLVYLYRYVWKEYHLNLIDGLIPRKEDFALIKNIVHRWRPEDKPVM